MKKWRWLYSGNSYEREVCVTIEHLTEEEAKAQYPQGQIEYSLLMRCPETEIDQERSTAAGVDESD